MADLMNITRRQAFKVLPVLATAVAVPAVALAAPEPEIMDPAAALEFHARELFKASQAFGYDQYVLIMPGKDGRGHVNMAYYLTSDRDDGSKPVSLNIDNLV